MVVCNNVLRNCSKHGTILCLVLNTEEFCYAGSDFFFTCSIFELCRLNITQVVTTWTNERCWPYRVSLPMIESLYNYCN